MFRSTSDYAEQVWEDEGGSILRSDDEPRPTTAQPANGTFSFGPATTTGPAACRTPHADRPKANPDQI